VSETLWWSGQFLRQENISKSIISVGHRHHAYVSNHVTKKQINTPPTTHSNQFQLFHDSNRQQYGMYIIHYSTELIAFSAEYTLSTTTAILI
jgi:hypothetical protein